MFEHFTLGDTYLMSRSTGPNDPFFSKSDWYYHFRCLFSLFDEVYAIDEIF